MALRPACCSVRGSAASEPGPCDLEGSWLITHTKNSRKRQWAELRELAKGLEHEAVKGYSQLNKEHLLPAVCQALGIDAYEHHHVVGAFDKSTVKAKMRSLKAERQAAIESRDHGQVEGSASSLASA